MVLGLSHFMYLFRSLTTPYGENHLFFGLFMPGLHRFSWLHDIFKSIKLSNNDLIRYICKKNFGVPMIHNLLISKIRFL